MADVKTLKILVVLATLSLAFLFAGCVSQGQPPAASPTPGGEAQQVQEQTDQIPLPSIEIPELGEDTGFENEPVDV